MADGRSRKLWGQVVGYLPPQWETQLKPSNVYDALSQAQTEAAKKSDCVTQQELEVDLEAGETSYLLADNIHRILLVYPPEDGGSAVVPADPHEWPALVELHIGESRVARCTLKGQYLVVTPAPVGAQTLVMDVSLKPAPNGDEDITEDQGPMVPDDFDKYMELQAVAELMRMLPPKMREGYSSPEYFETLAGAKLVTATVGFRRRQTQAPRGVGRDVTFPSG